MGNMDETLKAVLLLLAGGLLSLLTGVVSSILIHALTLRRELTLSAHKAALEAHDKAREEYKAALAATLEWESTMGAMLTTLLLLFGLYRKENPSVAEVIPFLHDATLPSGKISRPPQHQLALLKAELYEPLNTAQATLASLHILTTTEKGMPSMAELEARVQNAFNLVRTASKKLQEEYRLQIPTIPG